MPPRHVESAGSSERSRLLVEPPELASLLESDDAPLVLDVRWRLDRPDGRPDYRAGHVPGAVFVDLERELSGHGAPTDGRHPLPTIDDLERDARRWGLGRAQSVVVYDDAAGGSAARAWWLLRHAGVADVRVLDGAFAAWRRAGLPVETGDPARRPVGDVDLAYGSLGVLAIDQAAALPDSGLLLDARVPERYRGEVEPVDPRPGHIPGAKNAPAVAQVGDDGRFLPSSVLHERFAGLGAVADAPVGVYCGSGVTAATVALALELAGFDHALYPGSWSQWSNHPDRPAAVGPDAG